jgi:hypothetical protein
VEPAVLVCVTLCKRNRARYPGKKGNYENQTFKEKSNIERLSMKINKENLINIKKCIFQKKKDFKKISVITWFIHLLKL